MRCLRKGGITNREGTVNRLRTQSSGIGFRIPSNRDCNTFANGSDFRLEDDYCLGRKPRSRIQSVQRAGQDAKT